MTPNIYTNIEVHLLISKMTSIHERTVSSQQKPKRKNHTFLNITRWRNHRKTKIISISCHHMAIVTIFPMSQEFCNFDYVWESYANYNEDDQKFLLHKVSDFFPRVAKILRELVMNKWNVWYCIYIVCGEKILPWVDMQFKITNN